MTRSLPLKPSIRFLKLEAKSILNAHRNADSSCCDVLRHLYRFKGKSDREILGSQTSLQEVQFALSMDYGSKNWKELIDKVALRSAGKNFAGINYSEVKLRANGFVFDSYCLSVSEAARLLGKNVSYEDILAMTTNAFAPGFDICNDCKELWVAEAWLSRLGSVDIAWNALGLSISPLAELSDIFSTEPDPVPLAVIRNVMDSGKVIVSDCGWSHPDQMIEPWWAGIVVDVRDEGTVLGAHPNGRTDNIIESPDLSNMLAVSLVNKKLDDVSFMVQLFQENIRRLRGKGDENKPFSKTEYMAFGIDALDEWIKQMRDVPHFCLPCQNNKGSGWQSAATVARAVLHRSETAATFLHRHSENFSGELQNCIIDVSKCYDAIVSLLRPAIYDEGDGYKSFIGDIEKQKAHAETVLLPVRNELIKAADKMEEALSVFAGKNNI
jgi:hypothetical protein